MGNYIVTGAAGFIGSALAKKLISLGNNVVTIDNLSTGYKSNVPNEAIFLEANCQNSRVYEKLPNYKYDAIFHIAGQSSAEISFDNPSYDLKSNTESTLLLLKYAIKTGCKRLIFASSMSVYGLTPDKAISETNPTLPVSCYGISKLASEHYLRVFQNHGVNTTSLRLFNVYGPGQNVKNLRQGMVSIFLAQLLNDNFIHVKGSPHRYRDFIYIDDVVDAFLSCLNNNNSYGKIINIGTGRRVTIGELVSSINALNGNKAKVKYKGNTIGDVHGNYADISLARNLLSFTPKVPLEKGLKKLYSWAIIKIKRD